MNTAKLRQAMADNPGLSIATIAQAIGMPIKPARRAMEQLVKTGMAETCGAAKKGSGVSYLYRLTRVGESKGFPQYRKAAD